MRIRRRDESTGYLIWKLSNLMRAYLEARLDEIDLHVAQMGALVALHEQPSASVADLARDMCMTPQNLSLMMARFTREGWVQRNPHRTHGRIVQLELTPEGKKVMERAVLRAGGVDQKMVAGLDAAQRTGLLATLHQCVSTMEAEVSRDAKAAARIVSSPKHAQPNRSPRRRGSKLARATEGRR